MSYRRLAFQICEQNTVSYCALLLIAVDITRNIRIVEVLPKSPCLQQAGEICVKLRMGKN